MVRALSAAHATDASDLQLCCAASGPGERAGYLRTRAEFTPPALSSTSLLVSRDLCGHALRVSRHPLLSLSALAMASTLTGDAEKGQLNDKKDARRRSSVTVVDQSLPDDKHGKAGGKTGAPDFSTDKGVIDFYGAAAPLCAS